MTGSRKQKTAAKNRSWCCFIQNWQQTKPKTTGTAYPSLSLKNSA